jgi:hypothetical protein
VLTGAAGKKYSLQILPDSFDGRGHHIAFGQSPNGKNWWLLDPASEMMVFETLPDLAGHAKELLVKSGSGFTGKNTTVLVEVADGGTDEVK